MNTPLLSETKTDQKVNLSNNIVIRPYNWNKFEEDITDKFSPDDEGDPEEGISNDTPWKKDEKVYQTKIEIYGHNKDNERCCWRIENFQPYCYFELPEIANITWSELHEKYFKNYFTERMAEGNAPIVCKLVWRKKLYYYRAGKKFPFIMMSFRSESAMRHAVNICNKPIIISSQKITVKPREYTISSILKIIAMKGIKYSSWIQCSDYEETFSESKNMETIEDKKATNKVEKKGFESTSAKKISTFEHEYVIKWKSLSLVPAHICENWRVYPKILSFDIECNARNTKSMPVSYKRHDVAFQNGVTFMDTNPKTNPKMEMKQYLVVLGRCAPIPNIEIIETTTQKQFIEEFEKLIVKLDPDVLIGYNIMRSGDAAVASRVVRITSKSYLGNHLLMVRMNLLL
jgi:DNA polymerase elongation subunit (family B)